MPRTDEPELDPIIAAAMIEDLDETDEEKEQREEIVASQASNVPSNDDEEDDEDEDEDKPEVKDDKKSDDEADDEEDGDEEDPDKEDKPKPKVPIEAQDDPDLEDDKPKKSRKARRQERNEDFIASIRKDKVSSDDRQDIPDYQPLNYSDDKEFKPEELEDDRKRVGAVSFAKGAQTAKEQASQEQFWSELTNEAKITSYDPNLSFLNETTPDGKKNDNFDADKAGEVNEMYLELVGFKQHPKRDQNGRTLVDNKGNFVLSHVTVDRTDLSYEKFARNYVKRMKGWAEDFAEGEVDKAKDNITKQRKKQGVRPSGGKRRSLGTLKPGDISRMSDEELDANEDEIDRQIDAMLGL